MNAFIFFIIAAVMFFICFVFIKKYLKSSQAATDQLERDESRGRRLSTLRDFLQKSDDKEQSKQ
ncbi:MAG: hypothetical protein Q8Q23_01020 [bacterium]|nr:hypothetical protein [bacterium]